MGCAWRDVGAGDGRTSAGARSVSVLLGAVACVGVGPRVAGADWTHLARTARRVGVADFVPGSIGAPSWVRSTDENGDPITFLGQSGVVVGGAGEEMVFAVGRVGTATRLFAVGREAGLIVWSAPVPTPVFNSWSTPAVDVGNGTVIVASGGSLTAVDLASGDERWRTALQRDVVNASPLVTSDLGWADRAFITDFDGFGGEGRLYCVNVDPFHGARNPFQPGAIVWSVPLGGTSGNTPAYGAGVVYVAANTDESGFSPGIVRAFTATATAPPPPLWTFTNVTEDGFFGGVSVAATDGVVSVYAASYAFSGGQDSANLVKLEGATGALVWSVPCNRTAATPIPLGDGRVVLSTGIQGFGSVPSVQLFRDDGDAATRLWDTALSTWADANANGRLDPGEFLLVGGWTHQPLVARAGGGAGGGLRIYAGAIPTGSVAGACTDFFAIDLGRLPGEPGFVLERFVGAGSTPAGAGANLYTIGAAGLHAFGGAPWRFDVNGDGRVDLDDLHAWERGGGARDVDRNGIADGRDRRLLEDRVRAGELEDMGAGRW